MPDASAISLEDKYRLEKGSRALVSGRQALVRLPLAQRELDRRAGLNTAGFISGYRGSPLGGFDAELWKASDLLKTNDILFQAGLNEDLAMTAVAGTQQIAFLPGQRVDGVFGIWYGKGPGVDRSGDAIKHSNLVGVAPKGGILLVFGDDHAGKSSTTAHQSDLTLASWEVPILYPSNVAEILEYGLAGFAMSRFSGALIGLKLVNETAEGTGVLDFGDLPAFAAPDAVGADVHIRPEARAMVERDMRLLREKLPRAQAFARANRLDRITFGSEAPRFLIATAGKAYADVVAALEMLGIDDESARHAGIGVYKIALIYPLDPNGLAHAAKNADEIFFVEEKRAHAETQAKALLYHLSARPRITGKIDPDGAVLLPADLPLDMLTVANHLAARIQASLKHIDRHVPRFADAIARIRAGAGSGVAVAPVAVRRPGFCPGCPHNSSTKVPDGSFGATGIGCHGMVLFHADRRPLPLGHMGAEGAQWIGMSPYTDISHIFQNLGDGTYSHSGSLAIRAAVAAGVNITYKILYNDAVAMTGGQPVEGGLTVSRIVRQMAAEGVSSIVVVSDDPDRFAEADPLPAGTQLRHRDDLPAVQEALRKQPGTSILVYDQVCAAEKRRRRKVGLFPDPDRRIFINAAVCEGCGDCSVQSNCMAIQPLETELGRKRRIDQSACNKDFSCVKGFCPSFAIVEGARPRRRAAANGGTGSAVEAPLIPALADGFDMIIAGVGGTGVVTVSAIIGMAARIEGRGVSLYDMTGLSQKGGAVFSHIRLRADPDAIIPARLGPAEADLLLACDLIASVHPEVTGTIATGHTMVVGNSDVVATADFQIDRDLQTPTEALVAQLTGLAGNVPALLPAATLSEELLGDTIAANVLTLGYAWQRGVVPLKLESIEQAIRLNGRSIEANLRAFAAGRQVAASKENVASGVETLDMFVERRTHDLNGYWNGAYAARYADFIARIRISASALEGGEAFAWAVARSAYKLMAYKDEYEVARLYSDGRFRKALDEELGDVRKVKIMLSPPLLARIDPVTGRPRKIKVGGWIFPIFRGLAACRRLREGPLDMFGRTAERRLERALRDMFLRRMIEISSELTPDNLPQALALAGEPLQIRGFGFVKMPAAEALLARLSGTDIRDG